MPCHRAGVRSNLFAHDEARKTTNWRCINFTGIELGGLTPNAMSSRLVTFPIVTIS